MYFYIFVILSFVTMISAFLNLAPGKEGEMPSKYGDKYYSKTKFALFINKKINRLNSRKKQLKVDYFHEIAFWFYFVVFILSIIILIFDLSFDSFISIYLGKKLIGILSAIFFVPFIIYTLFIEFYWRAINKNESKQ